MFFRLQSKSTVYLGEECLALSEFFNDLNQKFNPRKVFTALLREAGITTSLDQSLEVLLKIDIKYLTDEKYIPECWSVVQQQGLLESLSEQDITHVQQAVQYTLNFSNTLYHSIVHRITFLDDKTLLQVVDFLNIPCPERQADMFDSLPTLVRASGNKDTILNLSQIRPYAAFLEQLDLDSSLKLARAGCILEIKPLVVLSGYKLSQFLSKMTEREIRSTFNVPQKFALSTQEKIEALAPEH